MTHKRTIFFALILPLLWTPCPLVQYKFPGDEYFAFAISSIPGLWGMRFVSGDIHDPTLPLKVALAGALTAVIIGLLMDWMRVFKKTWATLFFSSIAVFCLIAIVLCFTAKNFTSTKSWGGFIPLATTLCLYFSVVISVISKILGLVIRKLRTQPDNGEVALPLHTECLSCGEIMQAGEATCAKCGWSYKAK